jgi:hypothetical protein
MSVAPALELPRPPWHPMLQLVGERDLDGLLAQGEAGLQIYLNWYREHTATLAAANYDEGHPLSSNPYLDGFELPHWHDADYLLGLRPRTPETLAEMLAAWRTAPYVQTFGQPLRERLGLLPEVLRQQAYYIWIGLGGNRSGKSEYCAKRVVQSAMAHANSLVVCLAEDLDSSRMTQQKLIFKYLPPKIKRLNNSADRNGVFNIRYSKKGGFTQEQLVLPNGSQIVFKTYNQEPGGIEGWMLGAQSGRAVGMWMDESASTGWLEAGKRRCKYCGAVLLWSFTPIKGMTPAVKEAVGQALTLVSLPAELLPAEQRHVEDCPPGEMPYLAQARTDGAIVHYCFSQFNPFGTAAGTFYTAVRELCQNQDGSPKATVHVKRIAYGYTEDTTGRKFPAFSAVHIVRVGHLPKTGSLVQLTDPHGSRPYATIWVLVTPGDSPDYYVIRDWPDERTFGEWAVATERETDDESRKGWDGDPGPAQRELGWGVIRYKQEWLKAEAVPAPPALREFLARSRTRAIWNDPEWLALLQASVKYPWHRTLIQQAAQRGRPLEDLRESIQERIMDARFCNSEHATEHGGTCLRFLFEDAQTDGKGQPIEGMPITEASGNRIEHGCGLITDLLAYNKEQALVPGINAPRLYVSEEATQVRWALENFTGRAGESGACKEWIDLLRYLAEAAPCYIPEPSDRPRRLARGGSYG